MAAAISATHPMLQNRRLADLVFLLVLAYEPPCVSIQRLIEYSCLCLMTKTIQRNLCSMQIHRAANLNRKWLSG
jgi:hypothetical protein